MGTSQFLSVSYALYAANAGNVTNGGGFKHYIGEQFGGGVMFHLWKDTQGVEHGLVVALTDQSASAVWSNVTDIEVGSAAQSSWNGLANSNAIVAQAGHTSSAAKLCLDLVSGGQSDWYLPSIDELSLLWHNMFNVNKSLFVIIGAKQLSYLANYWSSTENRNNQALGYGALTTKNETFYVRAVRAF